MNYQVILKKVYGLAPKGILLGLERVSEVASRLNIVSSNSCRIQIAGTNGKGTTAAILSNALATSGARVGLFTSPHLHRFSERIRVNGTEAPSEQIGRHLELVLNAAKLTPSVELSFFEVATLAALTVFEESKVDYAILEVGLGGRLDSTSICNPALTAITSIGLDHTAILGETITKIAREKAGICKPNAPLVVGTLCKEALSEIRAIAKQKGTPLFTLGKDFNLPKQISSPFPGNHQNQNTAIAYELYRRLGVSDSRFTQQNFCRSLETIHWPARFELLRGSPSYLIDGAHNREAISQLFETIKVSHINIDTIVFGALRDKNAKDMLSILRPLAQTIIIVPPPIDRAMPPEQIAEKGDIICLNTRDALTTTNRVTPKSGIALVTGSFFTAAGIRALALNEPCDPPVGL